MAAWRARRGEDWGVGSWEGFQEGGRLGPACATGGEGGGGAGGAVEAFGGFEGEGFALFEGFEGILDLGPHGVEVAGEFRVAGGGRVLGEGQE